MKLYTLEDLKNAFESGENYGKTWSEFYNTDSVSRVEAERTEDFNGFIQSLQPKTEFEVEVKHICNGIKKEGESCTLNNKCTYPNCGQIKITNII
jgi:hypothetical protein